MSQKLFFFFSKSKSNQKNKKKTPKKKKNQKTSHILTIQIKINKKYKKRKNFPRCIGIPMGKVKLAKFVRSKKRNGGSFSSHFQ